MKIYPVVHANTLPQTLEQADLAFDAQADGVFLIDHRIEDELFLPTAFNLVRASHDRDFVGLNFLQCHDGLDAYRYTEQLYGQHYLQHMPDALWVDDARGIPDRFIDHQNERVYEEHDLDHLRDLKSMRRFSPRLRRIKLYGGTAFKYTHHYTDEPEAAATQAVENHRLIDVVTTSGAGTGFAPKTDKIRAMKEALGRKKLAVASGISEENIEAYRGVIDAVLVATSVETEKYSGIFDEEKLRNLIKMAHEL